jgi:phosphoserine phosphatase RsbU/P
VKEVEMSPRDVLMITSDGLTETSGKDDELFQDRELRSTLLELLGKDGGQVIERLVERAHAFSAGRPQRDDLSLIAITRA